MVRVSARVLDYYTPNLQPLLNLLKKEDWGLEEPSIVGVGVYQPQNKKGPSCISLLSLQFLFGFHVPFLVGCTAFSAHSYGRLLLLELALGPYRNLGVRGFSAPWPIHIFWQDKGFLHVDGFLGMPGTPPVSEAAVLGFYESLHLLLHRGLKANFPLTIIMRATQSIQAMLKFHPPNPYLVSYLQLWHAFTSQLFYCFLFIIVCCIEPWVANNRFCCYFIHNE